MQDIKINMLIALILLCIAGAIKAYQKRNHIIFWAFTHPLEVMAILCFICATLLIVIYGSIHKF